MLDACTVLIAKSGVSGPRTLGQCQAARGLGVADWLGINPVI